MIFSIEEVNREWTKTKNINFDLSAISSWFELDTTDIWTVLQVYLCIPTNVEYVFTLKKKSKRNDIKCDF